MTGKKIAWAINEIINNLDRNKYKHEAINWGDLSCIQVTKCKEIYPGNEKYYEALISEASPQTGSLCYDISLKLLELHGISVNVVSEW